MLSAILGTFGAAAQLGGTIFNAIKSNKARKMAADEAVRREANATAMANQGETKAERAARAQYDREAQRQMEIAKSQQVISGGTPESVVATQEAMANGRANLDTNLAAQSQERADRYNEQAELARQQGAEQQLQMEEQSQQAIAQGVANVATGLAGAFDLGANPNAKNNAKKSTGTAKATSATDSPKTGKGSVADLASEEGMNYGLSPKLQQAYGWQSWKNSNFKG